MMQLDLFVCKSVLKEDKTAFKKYKSLNLEFRILTHLRIKSDLKAVHVPASLLWSVFAVYYPSVLFALRLVLSNHCVYVYDVCFSSFGFGD